MQPDNYDCACISHALHTDTSYIMITGLTSCAVLAAMSLEVTMSCSNFPSPDTTLSAASLKEVEEKEEEVEEDVEEDVEEKVEEGMSAVLLTQAEMLPIQLA